MGRFFSDIVEQALRDIYYDVTTGRGRESLNVWSRLRGSETEMHPVFLPGAIADTSMYGAVMNFRRMMTKQWG